MEELGICLFLLLTVTFFSPQTVISILTFALTVVLFGFLNYAATVKNRWSAQGIPQPSWNWYPMGSNAANSPMVKIGWSDPVHQVRKQYQRAVSGRETKPAAYGTHDFGLSARPILCPVNDDLISDVLVRQADKFSSRRPKYPGDAACDTRTDRIWVKQQRLAQGSEWEKIQRLTSKVMSSENLSRVAATVVSLSDRMCDEAAARVADGKHLDLVELFRGLALDCVAQCVFRTDATPFRKDKMSLFGHVATKLLRERQDVDALRLAAARIPFGRRIMSALGVSVFKPTEVAYFADLIIATVRDGAAAREARKRLLDTGEDMELSLLDNESLLNVVVSDDEDVDDETLGALALGFVAHGMEETALVAARAAFEIQRRPKARQKILREIEAAVKTGGVTIDFESMEQTESVLLESARRYPVTSHLSRTCVVDSAIVGDVRVSEGEDVNVPLAGVSLDGDAFRNPEAFDPRRFLDGRTRRERRLTSDLSFGAGPRACPGKGLVLLVGKAGLAALLTRFEMETSVIARPDSIESSDPCLWVMAREKTGESDALTSSSAYMRMSSIEYEDGETTDEEDKGQT